MCVAFSRELEQFRYEKVECNWNNWVSENTIYMAVIVQAQLWRASALITYLDIIHRAYSSFLRLAWLKYDETFHM